MREVTLVGRFIRTIGGGFILALGSALVGAAVAKRHIPSVGTEEDDEIALAAILAPVEFESHATAFRGGTVLLWFGGGDVDLRGVMLDPGGASLTVRAIFGGGRLIVPETWDVDLRMRGIFGGSADVRPAFERDAPHLIVEGWTVFGGLAVFASKPEIDAADEADAPVD
jgi:hypothetical protein